MEWIKTKDCPPDAEQKNILCSGPDGGVYKPQAVRISKDGEVFARVNGRELLVYAYLVYPNPPKFRKPVVKGKNSERKKPRTRADAMDWPLNMFADIDIEVFRGCIFLNTAPDNFEKNWEQVAKSLTEREAAFIEMYYRCHFRLTDIASQNDLSRERVRQIIGRAIRKLRHKSRIDVILGKTNAETEDMKDNLTDLAIGLLDEHISYLEPQLSVRAYNALCRAGKTTKRDLLLMPKAEIRNIRNVGRVTANEIIKHKENIATQVGLKKPIIHDKIVP